MNATLRSSIWLASIVAVGSLVACSGSDSGGSGAPEDGGAMGGASTGGATGDGGGSGGSSATGGAGGAAQGGTGGAGTGGSGGTGGTGGSGVCKEGEQQSCYDGKPGTDGVGICKAGARTCQNGAWGPCLGQVIPKAAEECNLLDDDCNGLADEGLNGQTSCGQGVCQVTVTDCANGVPTPCVPLAPSPVEKCDTVDDDCDGTIDEGCSCLDGQTQPCYSGAAGTKDIGPCKGGTQTCAGGKWGACVGEVMPETETCDGLDNDCDGTADDGSPGTGQPCSTGKLGECATGVANCVSPNLVCNQTVFPTTEVCDNKDNNCDGSVDEGNPGGGASCSTGLPGVCGPGTMKCVNGSVSCVQNVAKGPETCDGLDNDCDGLVDDNCKCPSGTTQSCYTGPAGTLNVGICKPGTQNCQPNGNWGPCQGDVTPSTESCNNSTDDDCDGTVNEGCGITGPRIMLVALNEGHSGNLGGIAGADALCATQASAAGMTGTWKAFLSSSAGNVKDLFVGSDASLPVVNKSNISMYSTWTSVFSTLTWSPQQYFLSFKGQVVDEITIVSPPWTDADGWHGSNIDGTVAPGFTCNDWTSADSTVYGYGGEWDFYRMMTSGSLVETHACSYTAAVACVSKQL